MDVYKKLSQLLHLEPHTIYLPHSEYQQLLDSPPGYGFEEPAIEENNGEIWFLRNPLPAIRVAPDYLSYGHTIHDQDIEWTTVQSRSRGLHYLCQVPDLTGRQWAATVQYRPEGLHVPVRGHDDTGPVVSLPLQQSTWTVFPLHLPDQLVKGIELPHTASLKDALRAALTPSCMIGNPE